MADSRNRRTNSPISLASISSQDESIRFAEIGGIYFRVTVTVGLSTNSPSRHAASK